jgi:small subunit ribosomal protein S3
MSHKIHPYGFRLGITKPWKSKWFTPRKAEYARFINEDCQIRDYLEKKLAKAAVSEINIERSPKAVTIIINTARPGVIIGRGGEGLENLKKDLEKITKAKINLSILEVQNPELSATLLAKNIAEQIEKRIPYKRAVKAAIDQAMKAKALGIKITVKGRLGGAEIARHETFSAGSVPLQTLRADVDYAEVKACTTYGVVGVKVWVYLGEATPLSFSAPTESM